MPALPTGVSSGANRILSAVWGCIGFDKLKLFHLELTSDNKTCRNAIQKEGNDAGFKWTVAANRKDLSTGES